MPKTKNNSPASDVNQILIADKNKSFPGVEKIFDSFLKDHFKTKTLRQKFKFINETLLDLIQKSPEKSFLLSEVIDYIERVNQHHLLNEKFHITLFEFWLNQFSTLSKEDNYIVRAKIAGKHIPREDYQAYFPIGMNTTYFGSHFVAAHLSPDVDTMIASFWGWLDAFAARVGTGQHFWSLPGGAPTTPITTAFQEILGKSIFNNVARTNSNLTLRALDLVTQKNFEKKTGEQSASVQEDDIKELVTALVNQEGQFLGDWYHTDAELVRQVLIRFKSTLRWFENNFHVRVISLFSNKSLQRKDISPFIAEVFDKQINDCETTQELEANQKEDLNQFLQKVLHLEKGLKSTFRELISALSKLGAIELLDFQKEVESIEKSILFDKTGNLIENRPEIFHWLEKIINNLDYAIQHTRDYVERLEILVKIKNKVLGIPSHTITLNSDVEDIMARMEKNDYLSVVISEGEEKYFPLGVVRASDLRKAQLGTVSFRDFCNEEEVKMASYLRPISVIDHHKANFKTNTPPFALIGDAQSCNVLLAEQAFKINDHYSLGGMTVDEIDQEIETIGASPSSPKKTRLLKRLLHRRLAFEHGDQYYIHPERELAEYMTFLYAILDDTDLLTKMSKRDITCVIELVNRIHSLYVGKDIEAVDLDSIPKDKDFVKAASKHILQNPAMYTLYRKIYESKESEIESYFNLKNNSDFVNLFIDTKEQNGCCRVGQTKFFSTNYQAFKSNRIKLMQHWLKASKEIYDTRPAVDFFLHMTSTIASASDVYQNKAGSYDHDDEMWIWIPPTQKATDHLESFLSSFHYTTGAQGNNMKAYLPDNFDELEPIFEENFSSIPVFKDAKIAEGHPVIVLRFKAGTLNSRKAMITPFLPKIMS